VLRRRDVSPVVHGTGPCAGCPALKAVLRHALAVDQPRCCGAMANAQTCSGSPLTCPCSLRGCGKRRPRGGAGAGAYVPPAGAGADMTLRLTEPAYVLDAGLVQHRANTILDTGAPCTLACTDSKSMSGARAGHLQGRRRRHAHACRAALQQLFARRAAQGVGAPLQRLYREMLALLCPRALTVRSSRVRLSSDGAGLRGRQRGLHAHHRPVCGAAGAGGRQRLAAPGARADHAVRPRPSMPAGLTSMQLSCAALTFWW
jgi:hypothetical protein